MVLPGGPPQQPGAPPQQRPYQGGPGPGPARLVLRAGACALGGMVLRIRDSELVLRRGMVLRVCDSEAGTERGLWCYQEGPRSSSILGRLVNFAVSIPILRVNLAISIPF
eukprot:1921646-Rhodomonas_salina.1